MSAILLLVGFLLLLVVLPLFPLALAGYFTFRLVLQSSSQLKSPAKAMLYVGAILLSLSPYVYIYGRQVYRNHLCVSEGISELSFDPELWAKQHPKEARAVDSVAPGEHRRKTSANRYVESLNSRFEAVEEYIDRGFSVTENRLEIVDRIAGQSVARSRTFSLPAGSGKNLISFDISSPRSCYTDPAYWAMKDSLKKLGRAQ